MRHARGITDTTAALALTLVGLLGAPRAAIAGGFERTPPGARANGRGGADFVGGDSPMSLFYNPANIVVGGATLRVEGALHLHFSDLCMQRVEVLLAEDGSRSMGETFPNLCADTGIGTMPEFATTYRVSNRLALGLGVYVPPAAVRRATIGDPVTATYDLDGPGGNEPELTPTRFLLVQQTLLQAFLSFGFAAQPHRQFRFGASFGWGLTTIDYATAATADVEVVDLGVEQVTASADVKTTLLGADYFIPRFQIGAWTQPFRGVPFELGAAFQYTQSQRMSDATLRLETLRVQIEPAWVGDLIGEIDAAGDVRGVSLEVPNVPWLAFGARYAHKLPEPVDEVGDRLSTERFDLEADVVINFGHRMSGYDIVPPEGAGFTVPSPLPALLDDIYVTLPPEISIQKRWSTQYVFRAGGDIAIVPGLLAVRAGVLHETHGVTRGYESIDFQPFRVFSVHTGATLRVAHRYDLSVAYAHIFVPTNTLSPDEAQYRAASGGDTPRELSPIVNAGRFEASSDIIVLQAGAHF